MQCPVQLIITLVWASGSLSNGWCCALTCANCLCNNGNPQRRLEQGRQLLTGERPAVQTMTEKED